MPMRTAWIAFFRGTAPTSDTVDVLLADDTLVGDVAAMRPAGVPLRLFVG